MDSVEFVQNVKSFCLKRGIKPTVACKESGVGGSFINDIERGRVPSVSKVQMLADYLGVTTSELLGESPPRASPEPAIGFDDFTYAMQSEAGDLTEADKALLLSMARQLNEARKKRNGETD